jgi:hypothetical protein
LQAAIAVRKQELQLEHQQLEELLQRGTAAGVDPLDDPSVPPAVKVELMNDSHHGGPRPADAAAGCGTSQAPERTERRKGCRQTAMCHTAQHMMTASLLCMC